MHKWVHVWGDTASASSNGTQWALKIAKKGLRIGNCLPYDRDLPLCTISHGGLNKTPSVDL